MRKINSNSYGGKVIAVGGLFLMLIPSVLYFLNCILNIDVIKTIILVSVVIGIVIEVGFGCYLAIELRQDKKIDQYYTNNPLSEKTPQQILDESKVNKR